jgi:hypothetical protein
MDATLTSNCQTFRNLIREKYGYAEPASDSTNAHIQILYPGPITYVELVAETHICIRTFRTCAIGILSVGGQLRERSSEIAPWIASCPLLESRTTSKGVVMSYVTD